MHQEKYSLKWHTYSDHLKSMMKDLMINEDFSDITLVTEDKKQIRAHISVLSACSPVFGVLPFSLCRISPLYIITVCVIAQYGIVENRVDHISMTNGVDIWKGLITIVHLRKFQ